MLFDFNGTLSDDEPLVFSAYVCAFRDVLRWDLDRKYYDQYLVGRSDPEMVGRVVRFLHADPRLEERVHAVRRAEYRRLVAAASPVTEGAVTLVTTLRARDVRLGIVTGAGRDDVEAVLAATSIGSLFDVVITHEDVTRGKPDPEGFELAMRELRVSADSTIVLEDSLAGVAAAVAAGTACVAVEGSHATGELTAAAHRVTERLDSDVVALLDDIWTARREGRLHPPG